MNERENANESPRLNRGAYFLLLLVCISVSGCAIASETGRVFFLAKRTTHIEPKFYRYIRSDRLAQREARKLAEQAWAEYAGSSSRTDLTPDFENGFVEGFADYLYRGGSGEPPAIPPRGYWNLRFLNQFGKVSMNDWYEGFRQGAQDCKARGLRDMWVVPTSLYADEKKDKGDAAASAVTQTDDDAKLPPDNPRPESEALDTPAPDAEVVEPSGNVEPDSETDEQELDPGWLDEEPEPPQIKDDEESIIDDLLSIRQVRPAMRIPARSQVEGLETQRAAVPVVQASNQVDVPPNGATETQDLEREFRNILRQSNTKGNRLRVPTDTPARERLRIVYEPTSSQTAAVRNELDDFPVIPLEVGPRRTERQRPLPSLSAPTNWQAEGRSQELPLKVMSASDHKAAVQDGAPAAVSPEHEFDELEMLLKSAEDAAQLPRIIHKSDRKDVSANNREGTNAIRWRIRD